MMLLFVEEVDVFWLLVVIVETLLPPDYFSENMIGLYTDQLVLAEMIKDSMPDLHR